MRAVQQLGTLAAAGLIVRLREKTCCSEPWVEAIVTPGPGGQFWCFLPYLYPPGGGETLMRECPACKRICPPNGPVGAPCCDCETETAEVAFRARLQEPGSTWLKEELRRRWWRTFLAYDSVKGWWYSSSAISYAAFMDWPTGGLLGGQCLEQRGGELTATEEGNAFYADDSADPPTTSDERPQVNNVTDPRVSLQIALNRLNPPKRERGVRAPGCELLLLPETLKRLRKEITYYREKGQVIPSARRYTKPVPYEPAPEDFDREMTNLDRAYEEALEAAES